MEITRRELMVLGGAAVGAAMLPFSFSLEARPAPIAKNLATLRDLIMPALYDVPKTRLAPDLLKVYERRRIILSVERHAQIRFIGPVPNEIKLRELVSNAAYRPINGGQIYFEDRVNLGNTLTEIHEKIYGLFMKSFFTRNIQAREFLKSNGYEPPYPGLSNFYWIEQCPYEMDAWVDKHKDEVVIKNYEANCFAWIGDRKALDKITSA